jgi:hypothetical protein
VTGLSACPASTMGRRSRAVRAGVAPRMRGALRPDQRGRPYRPLQICAYASRRTRIPRIRGCPVASDAVVRGVVEQPAAACKPKSAGHARERIGRGRTVPAMRLDPTSSLASIQSAYYLLTGAAPFVSMRAFEAVTGPKRDDWLVKTVGLFALAFGVLLARDAARGRPDPAIGLAGALPFAAASTWYGGTGRISRIYLLDGALELAFAAAWLLVGRRRGDRVTQARTPSRDR